MPWFEKFPTPLQGFTRSERRDMLLYIIGVMLFKFGSEAFIGSVVGYATKRFDAGGGGGTFERIGILQGLNLGMRCLGSILVGPLLRKFASRDVLCCATIALALSISMLLAVDAIMGGRFKTRTDDERSTFDYYGDSNPNFMFPFFAICGLSNGIIDLVRSIIPRDIVGGNVKKLQKLDSMIHIFFAFAAASGSLTTGLVLIPKFGHNRAFILTPVCFSVAAFLFFHMSNTGFRLVKRHDYGRRSKNFKALVAVGRAFWLFGESFAVGARILFSSRNFIWLIPGYGLGSYAHRYFDTCIVPMIAKRVLAHSELSLIIVSGSSIGDLLGALIIFCWPNKFRTPIFWLRIDSFLLNLVWFFPFWVPDAQNVRSALVAGSLLIPMSFAWAANEVSVTAYIQASLTRLESTSPHISSLSAVVCFMYCLQIVAFATLSSMFGSYLDNVPQGRAIHTRLIWALGAQFSVISVVVFAATFIPKGSRALNPKMIGDQAMDDDINECGVEDIVVKELVVPGADTPDGQKAVPEVDLEARSSGRSSGMSSGPKIEERSFRETFRTIRNLSTRWIPWPRPI